MRTITEKLKDITTLKILVLDLQLKITYYFYNVIIIWEKEKKSYWKKKKLINIWFSYYFLGIIRLDKKDKSISLQI